MAIVEVKVPQLSESVAEATLLQWKKKPGEAVAADEILIEILTDKVVLEVPAPAAGVLAAHVVGDGGTVVSDQLIAQIDTEGKAGAAAPAAAAPVNAAVAKPLPAVAAPTVQNLADRPEQRVPMSRLRARIAERLVQSQSTNAILTTFNEVNMAPVMEMRKKFQDKFEKEHGVKLGFMSFFVKAAVHALKKFPVLNASVDGNDIVYHGYFDIGIAVGSPRGLVVPILCYAD